MRRWAYVLVKRPAWLLLQEIKALPSRPAFVSDYVHYSRLYRVARLRGERRSIGVIGTSVPGFRYAIWKVSRVLGLRLRRDAGDVALVWDDASTTEAAPGALNGRCCDIRKSTVDRACVEAFGYGLALDPQTHAGPCVRKSERNAAHDGVVLACPVPREPGFVYQRLVDNETEDGMVEDLRVVVVGERIPVVYRKRRRIEERFRNVNRRVWREDPSACLSAEERERLLALARGLGMDIGEIDVLRDRHDLRLHPVDVNKTPWGPPVGLALRERRKAVASIAEAFVAEFLEADGRAQMLQPANERPVSSRSRSTSGLR